MASSKSNKSYDMLISLCNKLTRLNGVITPEAVDKLEDKLGGIFTVTKTHHYEQGQSTAIWRVQSPRASTGSPLAAPPGITRYRPTQEHTLPMPSQQAMQPRHESSSWRNTRPNRRATGTT